LKESSTLQKISQVLEKRTRNIFFDHAPEIVIITDAKGKILQVNRKIQYATGYEPEEIVGIPIIKLPTILREDLGKIVSHFRLRIIGKNPKPFTITQVSKKGEKRTFTGDSTAIKDEKGRTLGVMFVMFDITEQKRKEEEASRMVTVVRDSNDAITIQN